MEGEELRGGDVIGDGDASSGEVMEKGTLSPLTGSYLLIVLAEPHSEEDREIILQRLNKGLLSWDVGSSHVDLNCELLNLTNSNPEGDEARNGEKLVQWASENLVVEVLIHSQVNTLQQCMKNLLASFTRHRHIIHAGYTFHGSGSWILQDGTFSLSDCLELWSEGEVQRILAAYKGDISVTMHCASEDGWTTERLSREPFAKLCQIQLNPPDKMSNVHNSGIGAFIEFISKMLIPSPLKEILEPSDIVGNIRFSRPTLYVFPGGQGDAALFGINGFNMLIDGGFSRKSCFWDFTRHLDRLDAVLLTRVNNNSVSGLSSVIQRKVMSQVYPQIGHFFGNLIDRKSSSLSTSSGVGGGGEDKKDEKNKEDASGKLLMSLTDEGHRMVENLRNINLKPHLCFRESTIEPINLYHKVGHGKLDLYVLNPAKDSREVKEFLSKWNSDCKSFVSARMSSRQHGESKDFQFPVLNLVSICALLVWQPANPRDPITRILFPGSTPQHKIFEALSKLKHLEFLKYPVCSAKTLAASQKSKIKSEKIISEAKEQLLSKVEEQQKDSSITRSISKTSSTVLHHRSSSKASKEDVSSSAKERASSAVARRAVSRSNAALNADSNKTKSESPIQKSTRQIKSTATSRIDTGLSGKAPKVKRATADSTGPKKSPTSPPPSSSSGKKLETTIGRVKAKSSESPPQTPPKSAKEANNRRVIEHKSKTATTAKTDKTTKTGAAATASTGDIKRKTISTTSTTTTKSSITTATTKSPTKKPIAKKAPVSVAPKPIRGVKKATAASAAVASAAAAVSSAISSSAEDLEAEKKIQAETNGSVSTEELLKTEQDGTKQEEEEEGEMATTGAAEDEEEAAAADEPTAVIEDEQPSSLQPGSLPFESGSELSSLDHISVQEDEGQTVSGDERASVVSRDQYETETVHGGADETEHEEDEEEEEYLIVEKEESTTDNIMDERMGKTMGSLDEPSIPEVQHDDDENVEEKIVKDEQLEVSKENDATEGQDDDTSKEKVEPVPQDILQDEHEKKDEGMKKNEENEKEQLQQEVEDEIKQTALAQLSQQHTAAQGEPADKDIQQLSQSQTVSDTGKTEEEPSAEPVEIVAGEKGDVSDETKAADSVADEQEATVATNAEQEKEEEKAEEAEVETASEVIQSTATQQEKQEDASEAVPAGQDTAASDVEESPAVKAPESLTDIQDAPPIIEAKELTATQESDGAAISSETKEILFTSTPEKDEKIPDELQEESTEPTEEKAPDAAVEPSEIDKTAAAEASAPDAKEESVTEKVAEEIVEEKKTNVETSAPQGAKDDPVPTTDDVDEISMKLSEEDLPVTPEASGKQDSSAEALSKDEPATSELSTKGEPITAELPTKDEPESAISSAAEAPATSEPLQEVPTSELSAQDQPATTEPSESIESVTKDKPISSGPKDQVPQAEPAADSEIPAPSAKDEALSAEPDEESQPLEPLVKEEASSDSAAKNELVTDEPSAKDEPIAVQASAEDKSTAESTTKEVSVTSEPATEIEAKISDDKPFSAESAIKEPSSKEEQTISETVTTADEVKVDSSDKNEPAKEDEAELSIILAGDETSADEQVKVEATADVTQDTTATKESEVTDEKSVADTTNESVPTTEITATEEFKIEVTKDKPMEKLTSDVNGDKTAEESAHEVTKEVLVEEKLVTETKEQESTTEEPTKIGPSTEQLLASETVPQLTLESLSTDPAEPSEVLQDTKLQATPDITTKEESEAVAKGAANDQTPAAPSEKAESKEFDSSELPEKSPSASPQLQLVEETIEKVEPIQSSAQSEKPAEASKPETDSKQSDSMPSDEKTAPDSQEISEKATEASQAEVTRVEPMNGTEVTQKQIAPSQEDVPKGPKEEEKDETVRLGDVNANSAIDSHVTQDDEEKGETKEEAKITCTVAKSALKGEAVGNKTDEDDDEIAEPTATSSTLAPSLLPTSGDEKVSCSDATESSSVIDDSAESKIPTDQLASEGINNTVAESMKILSQPESAISAEQSTLESEVVRCIEKQLPSSKQDEETIADKSPLEEKIEETVSQQDQHLGNNQTLPQQDKLDHEMEPLIQTTQYQVPQGSSHEKVGQEKQEDDSTESSQTKDQYCTPSPGTFQQPPAPAVEPLKDNQSGEEIFKEITSTRDVEQLKSSEQEVEASPEKLSLQSTTAEEDESIGKGTLSTWTKLDELSAIEIPAISSASSSLQEEKESSAEKLDDTKGEEGLKTEVTPTPQHATVATVEAASVSIADETTKAAEPTQLSAEKLWTQMETDTEEDEGGKPLVKEPTSTAQSEILKESEEKKSETRDEQTPPTTDDKLVAKETEQLVEKNSEAEVCISDVKEPEVKLQSLQEQSIPSGAQNFGNATASKSEEVCGIDTSGAPLPDDSSSAQPAREKGETNKVEQTELDERQVQESVESERKKSVSEIKETAVEVVSTIAAAAEEQVARRQSTETKEEGAGLVSQETKGIDDAAKLSSVQVTLTPDQGQADKGKDLAPVIPSAVEAVQESQRSLSAAKSEQTAAKDESEEATDNAIISIKTTEDTRPADTSADSKSPEPSQDLVKAESINEADSGAVPADKSDECAAEKISEKPKGLAESSVPEGPVSSVQRKESTASVELIKAEESTSVAQVTDIEIPEGTIEASSEVPAVETTAKEELSVVTKSTTNEENGKDDSKQSSRSISPAVGLEEKQESKGSSRSVSPGISIDAKPESKGPSGSTSPTPLSEEKSGKDSKGPSGSTSPAPPVEETVGKDSKGHSGSTSPIPPYEGNVQDSKEHSASTSPIPPHEGKVQDSKESSVSTSPIPEIAAKADGDDSMGVSEKGEHTTETISVVSPKETPSPASPEPSLKSSTAVETLSDPKPTESKQLKEESAPEQVPIVDPAKPFTEEAEPVDIPDFLSDSNISKPEEKSIAEKQPDSHDKDIIDSTQAGDEKTVESVPEKEEKADKVVESAVPDTNVVSEVITSTTTTTTEVTSKSSDVLISGQTSDITSAGEKSTIKETQLSSAAPETAATEDSNDVTVHSSSSLQQKSTRASESAHEEIEETTKTIPRELEKQVSSFSIESTTDQVSLSSLTTQTENKLEISKQTTSQLIPTESKSKDYKETSEQMSLDAGEQLDSSFIVSTETTTKPVDSTSQQDILQSKQTIETIAKSSHDPPQDSKPAAKERSTQPTAEETKEPSSLLSPIESDEKVEKTTGVESSVAVAQNVTQTTGSTAPGEESGAGGMKAHEITSIHMTKLLDAVQQKQPDESLDEKYEDESVEKETKTPAKSTNELSEDKIVTTDALHIQIPGPAAAPPSQAQSTERQEFKAADPKKTNDEDRVKPVDGGSKFIRPLPYDETTDSQVDKLLKESQELIDKERKEGTKGVIGIPSAIPSKLPRESREVIRTPDEVADLPVHEEVEPGTYETDELLQEDEEQSEEDQGVDAMGIANIPPAISPVPKTSEEINVTQQLIDTSSSPPNKPEALNEFTAPTKIDAAVSPVLESLLNGQAKKAFPEEATSSATPVSHIQVNIQTAEKTEEAEEKVSEMKASMDANQIKSEQAKEAEKDEPLEKPAALESSIEKELTDVLIKTVTTSVVITPSTPPVCRDSSNEAQFSYTEEKGAWETAEKDSQQQTSQAESEIIHEKKETSETVEGGGSEKSKVACLGTGSERERTLSTNSDESSTSSATPLTAVSNKEPTEPVRTQDTPPSSKATEARVESESNEQTEKNEAEKLFLLPSQRDGDKSDIYEGTNNEESSMGAVCSGLLTAITTLSAAVIAQSPEEFATKSFPGSGSESPQQQQQQDQSINKDTLQQALSSAEKVLSLASTIPTTADVEKTTNDLNLIGQTSSLSFTETTTDSIITVTTTSNTSGAGPDVPPQPPFSSTNECQVRSESNILESTVSEALATKLLSTITTSTTQGEKLDTEQIPICIDTSNEKGEKQDVEKPVSVSTTSQATSSGSIDPAASAVHAISATTTSLRSSTQQPASTSFQTASVPDNNNDLPNQACHVTLVDITSSRKSSAAGEEEVAAVEQAEQVVLSVIKETERQVEEKVKVAEELLQEVEEKLGTTAISLTTEQISVHDERQSSQAVLIADKNVGERPKTDEDEEEEELSSVVEKAEGESLEKSIAHSATATTTVTMTTTTSHPTSFTSNVESNLEQHKSLSPQTSLGKQDAGLFDSATTSTELETTLSSVHSQLTGSTISRGDDDDLMTTSGVSTIPDESSLLTSSLTTCGHADSTSKKEEAEGAEKSSSIKSQVKMETSDKSVPSSEATPLEQDKFTTEIHSDGLVCGKESSDKAADESKDKLASTFGDSSTLMEKRTITQLITQESSGTEKESHETFTRHISSSRQSEIGKQEESSQEQFASAQSTASTITSSSSQMSQSGLEASASLSSSSTASPSAMTSTRPGSTVTYTTTTITRHFIDGEEVKELRTESEKTTSEIMERSKEISSSGLSSSPLSSAGTSRVLASMEGDKEFVEIAKEREIARTSPGGSYYGVYGLVFGSAAAAEEAEENPTDEESVYGEDSQSHSLPNQSIVTTSSSSSTTTSTVVGTSDTGMTTITRAITGSSASTVTEQQGGSSLEEMMSSMRPIASVMGDKFAAFIHTSAASDAMDEGSYSSGDFSDSQLSTMAGAGGRDMDDIDNSTFDSDLPRSSDVENGNLPLITSVGDLLTTSTVTVPVSKEDEKTSSTTTSSTASFTREFTSQVSAPSSSSRQKEAEDDKDIVKTWGKPLGLPPVQNEEAAGTASVAAPEDATAAASKGTPKKDKSTDRKNPETPGRSGGHSSTTRGRSHHRSSRNISPIYVDLAYVPHHGNSNYCDSEFFRLCRARYYVFSGLEPSRQVFDGLLQGKQSWDDKNLEVTIIPTYDTDTLGYWVVDSEDALAEARIDLAPSASRCTINLQDHETSCAAYRLEF